MNKELLQEFRDARGQFFRFHCNAGTIIIRAKATLPRSGTVWFDNRCISNILSLSKAKNKYRVMHDNAEGNQFIMVMPGNKAVFNEIRNGLYYHDMEGLDLVLVNTVE